MIRVNNLTWTHHRQVAKLDPEQQAEMLNLAVEEDLSVRELRAKVKEERRELNKVELPKGKYQVIYADPPWKYGDEQDIKGLGGATKHYPLMSIQELCEMPISELVTENAVLCS